MRAELNKLDYLYNRWVFMRHHVQFKDFPMVNGHIMIIGDGTIKLGRHVVSAPILNQTRWGFRSVLATRTKEASIEIDDRTGPSNVVIAAFTRIYIGKDINIGAGTKIFDSDFHALNFSERSQKPEVNIKSKPITIKDRAFIGGNVIIIKEVTIGEEAVIGMGAVVISGCARGRDLGGKSCQIPQESSSEWMIYNGLPAHIIMCWRIKHREHTTTFSWKIPIQEPAELKFISEFLKNAEDAGKLFKAALKTLRTNTTTAEKSSESENNLFAMTLSAMHKSGWSERKVHQCGRGEVAW